MKCHWFFKNASLGRWKGVTRFTYPSDCYSDVRRTHVMNPAISSLQILPCNSSSILMNTTHQCHIVLASSSGGWCCLLSAGWKCGTPRVARELGDHCPRCPVFTFWQSTSKQSTWHSTQWSTDSPATCWVPHFHPGCQWATVCMSTPHCTTTKKAAATKKGYSEGNLLP